MTRAERDRALEDKSAELRSTRSDLDAALADLREMRDQISGLEAER